jgi:hypothetical protein
LVVFYLYDIYKENIMNKSYTKIRQMQEANQKLESRLIKEQDSLKNRPMPTDLGGVTAGRFATKGPGPGMDTSFNLPMPVLLTGALFLNGISKIDTNSDQFKKGVQAIQDAVSQGTTSISVEGGASAVGKAQGYDNNALAAARANNFINAVKPQFPNVTFNPSTKVGTATVKNSPEANAEQYVKLTFLSNRIEKGQGTPIDNTANFIRTLAPVVKNAPPTPPATTDLVSICFKVPRISLSVLKQAVKALGGTIISQ